MGTLKKIEKLVLDISILLFVVMLGIVLFQILVRNLFGKSFAQLEELAIIILPCLSAPSVITALGWPCAR